MDLTLPGSKDAVDLSRRMGYVPDGLYQAQEKLVQRNDPELACALALYVQLCEQQALLAATESLYSMGGLPSA